MCFAHANLGYLFWSELKARLMKCQEDLCNDSAGNARQADVPRTGSSEEQDTKSPPKLPWYFRGKRSADGSEEDDEEIDSRVVQRRVKLLERS